MYWNHGQSSTPLKQKMSSKILILHMAWGSTYTYHLRKPFNIKNMQVK